MPRGLGGSALMKPFVVLALPGMYLFYKYSQYKRQQLEQNRRKVTERELAHLNNKIDKLLTTLEEKEPEIASTQEDECVICVNAKASMETWPCGHRVVCRKCFVKTIQVAVSQRLLPLRCVICRAKILRLKQTLASSASDYSITQVHNSESLYSMASASSSISGCSSTSMSSAGSGVSSKIGGGRHTLRQPQGPALRKTQTHSMKYHLQEYKEPVGSMRREDKTPRLTPIQEFQREYRLGKERSSSTRIRCAQKIVTQLESVGTEANNSTQQQPGQSSSRRSSHGFSFGKTNCSQLQKKAQKEEQKRQKNLVKKIARLEAEEAREAASAAATTSAQGSSSEQPSPPQDSKTKKDKNTKQDKKDKEKKDAEKKESKKENKKESKSEKKANKNKESKSNN